MASPTPVLPEVGSTIVPPGWSSPEASAASIIRSAMRSFTEPPGFRYSTFASTRGASPSPSSDVESRSSGVLPIRSRREFTYFTTAGYGETWVRLNSQTPVRNLTTWGRRRRHASSRRPRRTAAAASPCSAPVSTACCAPRPSWRAERSARPRANPPTHPAGTAAAVPGPRSGWRSSATRARRATAWSGSWRRPARCWAAGSRCAPTDACTCGTSPSSAPARRTWWARSTGPCPPSRSWR